MYEEIYLDAPNLGELEKEYLLKAVDSGYVSTAGPFVPEFETKFADYLNVKSCVSTQSGTAALHIALIELGIKEGDEVVVPAITFVASVNPILYVGATPVFVDITPDTWNMNPVEIEKAITPRTKAIIPVHLYGNPCNMDAIQQIAERYGLAIIEDATESLGATYRGKFTGTFGQIGCFSFNGNKIITTGGGGMVATNNSQMAKHMKFLVNQARDESKGYFHPEVGFNYRMTNLEAALGIAQLSRLQSFLTRKRELYQIYKETFQGIEAVEIQKEEAGSISSAWLSSIKIDTTKVGLTIPEIQEQLKIHKIPSRRIFMPITEFPPYQRFKTGDYRNTYELYEKGLNLPSSTLNSQQQIIHVAKTLYSILSR